MKSDEGCPGVDVSVCRRGVLLESTAMVAGAKGPMGLRIGRLSVALVIAFLLGMGLAHAQDLNTLLTIFITNLRAGQLIVTPLATAPSAPVAGTIYIDSTPASDELCVWDGAAWQGLTSGTDGNCA